ncbi:hypothetical protein N779_01835 [Vibrio coralliilyticus OCN008]|nr:hypothetical protein N779_01835 [Vibrio coralliilyticus OCN008]
MDMLALSQKQKVTLFLIVLTIGFVILAVFTSSRLTQMSEQYHSSGDISSGSISIYQTQSKILTLSSELDNLEGAQVAKAKQDISDIVEAVNNDVAFLNVLNLKSYANELEQSIGDFQAAANPWLELKQELGFNIDEAS